MTERRCCCASALPIAPGEVPVIKPGLPVQEFLPYGRAPINRVLQQRGNGAVVFRGNDQDSISFGEFAFEAHSLFRQVAFKVLIEHRQIVDADEAGVELISTELGKGASQFAVNRIAAVCCQQ
jgi:hypothetical protein